MSDQALPELAPLRDGETLYRRCPECDGTGVVRVEQNTWAANYYRNKTGIRTMIENPCSPCDGTGYIALAERRASDERDTRNERPDPAHR